MSTMEWGATLRIKRELTVLSHINGNVCTCCFFQFSEDMYALWKRKMEIVAIGWETGSLSLRVENEFNICVTAMYQGTYFDTRL
jgi:hypothetical protein